MGLRLTANPGSRMASVVSMDFSNVTNRLLTQLNPATSADLASVISDETGTGSLVFATGPTITLTNATGLPVSTGISGLGTGVAAWLATPSSANLATAVTGETGSGGLVFATSPTLVTPVLGVATMTSMNKVAITAPATSATLTLVDGTTLTGPAASGTAMTLGNAEVVTGAKTFGAAGNVGKLLIAGTTSGTTILNATAIASGTLTLPAATDTLVGKATTDILTNKTFNSVGTGNTLQVSSVTVSAGQFPGETTTGSATAGNVGEYIESVIASGSATSLTTGTAKTITSISLTAGDWDVSGNISFNTAAGTSVTGTIASLSGTTNTNDATPGKQAAGFWAAIVPGSATAAFSTPVGPYRLSLSGTTTVFLVATGFFTVSTLTGHGIIRARRAR